MSTTGVPPCQHGIRQYTPSDKQSILTICKTVYGGRDYIPKTIDSYAKSGSIDVYVYEKDKDDREPIGLLCGQTSGSLYHLWGARTHPDHRGKGIMTRMMGYIEERARSVSEHHSITHMVSTTIQENRSMLNIFDAQGYQHHATVYGWPYTGTPQSMKENLIGTANIPLDMIDWTPCASIDELTQVLAMLRADTQQVHVSESTLNSLWIPASYEVISSNGLDIIEALKYSSSTGRRQIFIGRQSGTPCGVIARLHSQLGSPIASIVYNQPSLALPIISSVFDLVPDVTRLYIDSCNSGHPCLDEDDASSAEMTGWYEYLVLMKPIKPSTIQDCSQEKKSTHVHLLTGCRIHHDGDAPVSRFFHKSIERGSGADAGTSCSAGDGATVVYSGSVRGRKMKGIEQQIPQGYGGYCCLVTDSNDEGSTVCIESRFDTFTYWKHHVVPDSQRDSFVRCMEWASTAVALHEDDDDE